MELCELVWIAVCVAAMIAHKMNDNKHFVIFLYILQPIDYFFIIKICFCSFSHIFIKPYLLFCF